MAGTSASAGRRVGLWLDAAAWTGLPRVGFSDSGSVGSGRFRDRDTNAGIGRCSCGAGCGCRCEWSVSRSRRTTGRSAVDLGERLRGRPRPRGAPLSRWRTRLRRAHAAASRRCGSELRTTPDCPVHCPADCPVHFPGGVTGGWSGLSGAQFTATPTLKSTPWNQVTDFSYGKVGSLLSHGTFTVQSASTAN